MLRQVALALSIMHPSSKFAESAFSELEAALSNKRRMLETESALTLLAARRSSATVPDHCLKVFAFQRLFKKLLLQQRGEMVREVPLLEVASRLATS